MTNSVTSTVIPSPTELKSVQNRIIEYATQIGWEEVSRADAELLRSFDNHAATPKESAKNASWFFNDVLFAKVKEFNPAYEKTKEELVRTLSQLQGSVAGNREFLTYLRGEKTFYVAAEKRERNLKLIDYNSQEANVYHVTKEYYGTNGAYSNREDIVFLINGIPILVIECKNATKDEAIAIGVDQLRRYHDETPEMMTPQQIFTVTESLGFSYGVTWNMSRRNIFSWKHKEIGNLEVKVKSFCTISQILMFLKNFILFAEKDEQLEKFILKQHQTEAVDLVVGRAQDTTKGRGLIWHTQGSGKTFTIIKSAEILYKAPSAEKPTILLMIDRNELQDQMMRNLESLGIGSVTKAESIRELNELLKKDYRGIIVTMIHKFRGMEKNINQRKNIFILIDEAHRSTGGDLGTYLLAAIPNASLIGFTGTPVDKIQYGKGTFKIFGVDDKKGYLHKYSIADSIKDGTTLPLFYALAPNEMRVPAELLEQEFFALAKDEGITDIEELNRILEKAVRTKTFLKAHQRIKVVAKYVSDHYQKNVEPMGYKAFLVAVDREACALYKKELDKHLPSTYSKVVYTAGENDGKVMKEYYLTEEHEKQIRKDFAKLEKEPKILIVTEKLLTGFDAPVLYAMYLDKPMRDHTLLQAIARVNRPYENEEKEMKKPHGFVLDFIGIFDKLEKALSFDSDEVGSVVKDIDLLKNLFKERMEKEGSTYLKLVEHPFTDKETDKLINNFKDKSKRSEFFKIYKQLEMLYEIISPDAFLAPYIDRYVLLSKIYSIVRNAFTKRIYVDREFMRKTEDLVKHNVEIHGLKETTDFFEINEHTLKQIKDDNTPDNVKIINLIKSIEKAVNNDVNNLMLLSMRQKAEQIQERYEDTQETTKETLTALQELMKQTVEQKKEQAEKQFDDITYFVFRKLSEKGYKESEQMARGIKEAFVKHPYWKDSDKDLRALREEVYYAILGSNTEISMDEAVAFVDEFFSQLFKAFKL